MRRKLSSCSVGAGHLVLSGVKSALRRRLWILTRNPSLLNIHRSVLPPLIGSAPVGVSVVGAITAMRPVGVSLISSCVPAGSGSMTTLR